MHVVHVSVYFSQIFLQKFDISEYQKGFVKAQFYSLTHHILNIGGIQVICYQVRQCCSDLHELSGPSVQSCSEMETDGW